MSIYPFCQEVLATRELWGVRGARARAPKRRRTPFWSWNLQVRAWTSISPHRAGTRDGWVFQRSDGVKRLSKGWDSRRSLESCAHVGSAPEGTWRDITWPGTQLTQIFGTVDEKSHEVPQIHNPPCTVLISGSLSPTSAVGHWKSKRFKVSLTYIFHCGNLLLQILIASAASKSRGLCRGIQQQLVPHLGWRGTLW